MKNAFNLIYLLLILTLSFSCDQKQSSKKKINNSDFVTQLRTDTLKFTSGIRSILQDKNRNYWFGSLQEGVCLYDGKTITYFTVDDGLSSNQVLTIQEDDKGNIWFGTAKGMSHYDGDRITKQAPLLLRKEQSEWMKTENDLWFNAGNSEGVYRYDGQKLNYLAFPNPKVTNPNNVYFVTCLDAGKHDMVWIGTYAGIYGYNGRAFTVINDETLGFKREGEYLHIRSILEDSKGRLWIGNNGIGVLLHTEKSTINFSEKMRLIHANSTRMGDPSPVGTLEHVFTIEEDHHGNIWFGDRDSGIWKFDGESMFNYTTKDGLSDDFAQAIYKDKKGELWFGLSNGAVYTFNGESFDKKL